MPRNYLLSNQIWICYLPDLVSLSKWNEINYLEYSIGHYNLDLNLKEMVVMWVVEWKQSINSWKISLIAVDIKIHHFANSKFWFDYAIY